MFIFDTTFLDVPEDNPNYELATHVKQKNDKEEEEDHYGYKLGTIHCEGFQVRLWLGSNKVHDINVLREMAFSRKRLLKDGDLLIFDRGLVDGETISRLKKEKGTSVIFPLKKNMKRLVLVEIIS